MSNQIFKYKLTEKVVGDTFTCQVDLYRNGVLLRVYMITDTDNTKYNRKIQNDVNRLKKEGYDRRF